jgi:large subunit ribosomal protein L6
MSTEAIVIKQSRVGKIGVPVPKGVTVTIANGSMNVKGPKGDLTRPLPPNVDVKQDAGVLSVKPTIGGRDGARFQGLTRALLNTMVKGVSESYVRTLELKGTGYRAEVKGPILNLALGFSHPVNYPIPKGVVVVVPPDSKGTLIVLTGADKEVMGQTAATIRGFRPPEPYGGKGVRYQGEKVREKAAKGAGKGGK